MKFKKTARIKEPISALGLGCWAFSGEGFWDNSDDDKSCKIIAQAVDLGVSLLDVAPIYGDGRAESVVGKALKGLDRSKILIASKCGLLRDQNGRIFNCLSKKSILKEIDDSLRRLATDYIDIYQLHWPDLSTPLDETLEAITAIKKVGKIRYFGLSNFSVYDAEKIDTTIEVASMQGLYNMLERNPRTYHDISLVYRTEREILPHCLVHGQAFFPYSPLMQGLLAGGFKESGNFTDRDVRTFNPKLNGTLFKVYYEATLKLNGIARDFGRPLNQVAVNWLIQNPAVTSVIGSALTSDELKENVQSLEWEISPEMRARIDAVLQPFIDM